MDPPAPVGMESESGGFRKRQLLLHVFKSFSLDGENATINIFRPGLKTGKCLTVSSVIKDGNTRHVFCCYDNIEFFNQSMKLQAFSVVRGHKSFPFLSYRRQLGYQTGNQES